jgi:glycosyltransferase involved in cell wall biosynthesis
MNWMNVFFIVFVITALFQLVAYLLVYSRFIFYKVKPPQSTKEPVSVVIAARNEEQNLLDHLPLIFNQNYPDFEVIVIDDCSYDDTQDVLRAFKEKYDNLKVVTLKESNTFSGGKKFALTLGIKAAEHEIVVFTDADCKPSSENWLTEMAAQFHPETEIVLGYGGYESQKKFLNMLIRFDTIHIAIQYLSFAIIGLPYMGVGRNLAYKKSLFFKNKGFSKHLNISSGDDDLFINQVGNKKNTAISISTAAKTVSAPKLTFNDWFNQKRRHITTGVKYKFAHQLILGLLSLSSFLYILSFVVLVIQNYLLPVVLTIFLTRVLLQFIFYRFSMKKIGEQGLWYLAPVFEMILTFIYPLFALSNLFIKQPKWKQTI